MALFVSRRQGRTPWLAMALILAAWACGDPSPLKPDPVQRLTGTYTMTVTMSASCRNPRGPWAFRADIKQTGRDFDVALYEGNFLAISSTENLDRFRGQDNPDAVLFFSRGGDSGAILFGEGAVIWTGGQARGQFRDGHINAVFTGTAVTDAIIFNGTVLGGTECRATDHAWALTRR